MRLTRGLRIGAGGFGRGVMVLPAVLMSFLLMFMVSLVATSESFQPQINRSEAASDNKSIDVSVDILPVLTFGLSTNNLALGELDVVNETLATGNLIATVSTNNPVGYALSVNMKTDEQCMITIVDDGTSCSALSSIRKLAQLPSTDMLAASIPTNTWGGAVTPFTNFNPIPAASSSAWNLHVATEGVINEQTVLQIGARADMLVVPGLYRNTIVVNAVANPLPVPVITDISPDQGVQGTPVVLTGVNFDYLFDVLFGDNSCENLDVTDDTSATCEAPEGFGLALITTVSVFGQSNLNTPTFAFPDAFAFTIDTRMTDTIDTDAGHFGGAATGFSIPTSGYVGGASNHSYDWIIDWGDGSPGQMVSGTSSTSSAGITHDYVSTGGAGEYQIVIKSNGPAYDGWMDAFGFYSNTSGANVQTNKNMFKSIDTPISELMRTKGSAYRFGRMFYGARNAVGIPEEVFAGISSTGDSDVSAMFRGIFEDYGYNSTTATIPAGLFASIDTTGATDVSEMFRSTFSGYAYYSTSATIPAGLFASIDTSSAGTTSNLFRSTFSNYGNKSTVGSIPANLFDSIDTSSATDVSNTFYSTFNGYANSSTIGTIPAGLFVAVDTSNALDMSDLFFNTFNSYAQYSNGTIPSGLFNSIRLTSATDVENLFRSTFYDYAYNSSGSIPAGLFSTIDTAGISSLSAMFYCTFYEHAYNSTTATIPTGLFSHIDTSDATNVSNLFYCTFHNYAYSSVSGTIPAALFDSLDLSSASNVTGLFVYTFRSYAYANTSASTDINSIWGNANFAGRVTATNVAGASGSETSGVFYQTFWWTRSLTGTAQTFINTKLGGITPTYSAQTFTGTQVSDLGSLNANWK